MTRHRSDPVKKIISALVLFGLLVISGCAGRGSFFEWGDGVSRASTVEVREVRTVPPCGG